MKMWAQRKVGRKRPSHGPLRFITRNTRFALALTIRKTKRLRRRLGLQFTSWLSSQFNSTFLTKIKIKENLKKKKLSVSGNCLKSSEFWPSLDMFFFFSSFQTPCLRLFLYIGSASFRLRAVSYFFFVVTSLYFVEFSTVTLHGDRWWNRTNVLIDINPLITHPARERLYHTTGVYALDLLFKNSSMGSFTSHKNQNSERAVRGKLPRSYSEKTKMSNHS